jgi:hypothetical protein
MDVPFQIAPRCAHRPSLFHASGDHSPPFSGVRTSKNPSLVGNLTSDGHVRRRKSPHRSQQVELLAEDRHTAQGFVHDSTR